MLWLLSSKLIIHFNYYIWIVYMFVKRPFSLLVVALLMAPALLVYAPATQRPVSAEPTINYQDYDYYVQNFSVYMNVLPIGDIEFFEVMNFSFNRGSYSMAYREVPHEGFEAMSNVDVTNSTGGSLSIGSKYVFDMFKGKYIIRWPFNPINAPANTTFYVSYYIRGAAVSVAKDQLGFDWNVVGKGWSVPIKRLNVYIFMFSNVTKSPLFQYYPKDSNVSIDPFSHATKISFNRTNITPGRTVRAIVYYPKNLEPVKSPERILRESSMTTAMVIFLIAFFLCLAFVVYRVVAGRLVPRTLKPNMQIAQDPVKLTTLIKGRYTPLAFFAGIVRLAQLGFMTIEDDRGSGELWLRSREEGPDELTMPLMPYDGALMAVVAEGPGRKPLHEAWQKVGRDMGPLVNRDLWKEGLFSRAGRFNIGFGAVIGGAVMAVSPMGVLYFLIVALPFYAVVFGGILLGITLAGIAILVLLGFLVPRHTARGAQERSQQAANLESIAYQLDRLSKDTPRELPLAMDRNIAVLTAAPMPVKGGFPTFLRKLGAQAPDAPYHHPWFNSSAAPEGEAKGATFGIFAGAYADTLTIVPLYFRGRTAQRPEERPPVEGAGQKAHGPRDVHVIHERPAAPPKKAGAQGPRAKPPLKKEED